MVSSSFGKKPETPMLYFNEFYKNFFKKIFIETEAIFVPLQTFSLSTLTLKLMPASALLTTVTSYFLPTSRGVIVCKDRDNPLLLLTETT